MTYKYYVVGPDLDKLSGQSMVDMRCEENALMLGITTNENIAKAYIEQYNHVVDFKIMTFEVDALYDEYDAESCKSACRGFPMYEIFQEFGVDVYTGLNSSNIELIQSDNKTIHPSNWIFTMFQYDMYIQDCMDDLYLHTKVNVFAEALSELHILSKYIRDNDDICNLIVSLFARYLMISEVMQLNDGSGSGLTSQTIAEMFGYNKETILLENFISNEKMVEEWMLRWGY